jgi:hypothetical protein
MSKVREQLGFLVHLAEMFNHYGAVWKLMPSDGFEIVVTGSTEERERIHRIAAERGYRSIDAEEPVKRGERYRHLVSNHCLENINGTPLAQILGEYNIRFMYALGKARHNFATWNRLYNMIMCFGPYQVEKLALCESAVKLQMGYPRYDEYFSTGGNAGKIAKHYGCNLDFQTIVWLPTWRELCSLDLYAKQIALLASAYNIVVKPHPLSVQTERARIEHLHQLPFTAVVTDHVDNLELFRIADYVICDYGGPAFGALYLDKNIILLNVPGAENDALTGPDSADIALRRSLPNLDAFTIPKIWGLLEDDATWEQQKRIRRQLRDYYFAPYQGFAASVAAQALGNRELILAA